MEWWLILILILASFAWIGIMTIFGKIAQKIATDNGGNPMCFWLGFFLNFWGILITYLLYSGIGTKSSYTGEPTLSNKLIEYKHMLDQNQISREEYDALRAKALKEG